jgi:hypothetical protein
VLVFLAACRYNFHERVDAGAVSDANADAPTCGSPGADWANWRMPNDPGSGRPNPASYVGTGNTVIDNVTGLVWQAAAPPGTYDWPGAIAYCQALALDGACWRLPHRVELASIVNYSRANPAIEPIFGATPANQFWSATVAAGFPTEAWTMNFMAGHSDYVPQTELHSVRCVQVTPPSSANRYQLGPTSVVDLETGLEWEQPIDPGGYTFAQADAYCAGLGSGWREPSIQELHTLVDSSRTSVLIDTTAFPGTPGTLFWSSSPQVLNVTMGWSLDFAFGYAFRPQTAALRVRCVRP